jgi:hypothetical protein
VSAARTVTVRDTRAPFLGRVTMKRRRFRVATRKRPRRGSNFRFALGEDATVFIKIQRRRKGGKRFVSAGRRLRRKLTAGRKRVKFSGRIGRRALRPGRYRANLRAVDASSNRSRLRRVRFVIVR